MANDRSFYLKKHGIKPEHILAVYCKDRKAVLCFDDGEALTTSLRFNEIYAFLQADKYEIVSRGVALRRDGIAAISNDGIYTMIDGNTFQGRKRCLKAHKDLRKELNLETNNKDGSTNNSLPLSLLEKCSVLDDLPLAFCVIELVFDKDGHGIDFIFRYCDKQMEILEGLPLDKMLGHSFYEIFKNGDKKWLVAYADVALNGVQRIIKDYSPEIEKTLSIHCYQPSQGYCACLLQILE